MRDRIYKSFEEFEREELRSMESVSESVDDVMDAMFGELDFDAKTTRRASGDDEDE